MARGCRLLAINQSDRDIISALAYDTGFFGEPLDRTSIAYELWKAIYVDPYFSVEKSYGYVAVDESRVVGYIIGGENNEIENYYKRNKISIIARALRSNNKITNMYMLYYLAMGSGVKAEDDKYPIHFHIAVSRDSRRNGCGSKLVGAFIELMRREGYPGIQIGVPEKSIEARRVYRKYSFKEYARWKSRMWYMILRTEVEYIRMIKSL